MNKKIIKNYEKVIKRANKIIPKPRTRLLTIWDDGTCIVEVFHTKAGVRTAVREASRPNERRKMFFVKYKIKQEENYENIETREIK